MKKRIFALMTAVVLVLTLGSTLAFSVENRVIDEAGIFTQEEIAQLESLAEKYSAACGLELMIVTKESTGSMSADWYARRGVPQGGSYRRRADAAGYGGSVCLAFRHGTWRPAAAG